MCEFYRRYVLVYAAAHVTALLALDEHEDIAIREGYIESLDKEISDFKSFVKRKTGSIINLWQDNNLYKQNCLMSATKIGSSSDKITWSFITGSYGWGPCTWETYKKDAPNPEGVCNEFNKRIENNKPNIRQKASSFWQSYQDKLFSSTSIYSRVQKMATARNINTKLLDEIMKKIKDGDKKATTHGSTALIGTADKASENRETESKELGNLANMHKKENKTAVEKLKYENSISDDDEKDSLSNSSTNNEKSKDREIESSANTDNINEIIDERTKEVTDNSINEEEKKFLGSVDRAGNKKESLVSNEKNLLSSHGSSIFEDDDNDVQKLDNEGKAISEK